MNPKRRFSVPDTAKTIGFPYRSWWLAIWVDQYWNFGGGSRFTHHIATKGDSALAHLASRVTTIDLRPDLTSERRPSESALGGFLEGLPRLIAGGDLIYSSIFCTPPSSHYDNGELRQCGWVNTISLKTSGRGHETEEERWNTLLPHLHFIRRCFPNLQDVDLYGACHSWRERQELREFDAWAQEKVVALLYVL